MTIIDTLKSFSSSCEKKTDVDKTNKNVIDFEQEYIQIKEQLEQIADGQLCLNGVLNYEYDDWYGDDEEFIFSDTNDVVDVICEACEYVHKSVECEEYTFGYQIAELLIGLEISVDIEDGYDFYDTLGPGDLEQYGLGNIDYKGMVVEGLYCDLYPSL